MATPLPSLFISHGAPDLPIRTGPTQDFLRRLLQTLPKPRAILAVSAHWLTTRPMVNATQQPRTIYDFGGFSPALYDLTYPALGQPELAEKVAALLSQAGFSAGLNSTRGYDHGVWTPLILADPDGTLPVVQLSIQPRETPHHHLRVGQALAPLREAGVLIVGSGAATHNLWAMGSGYGSTPPGWVVEFDGWLAANIAENNLDNLLNYRQVAPFASKNHPTEEHLFPLFVVIGAGRQGRQIHHGFTYGALSMAAYAFD